MTAKKTPKATPPPTPADARSFTIQNCSIVNTSAANEHTRDAIVALADAIKANANAVIAAAEALKGAPAHMDHGIFVSGANSN